MYILTFIGNNTKGTANRDSRQTFINWWLSGSKPIVVLVPVSVRPIVIFIGESDFGCMYAGGFIARLVRRYLLVRVRDSNQKGRQADRQRADRQADRQTGR